MPDYVQNRLKVIGTGEEVKDYSHKLRVSIRQNLLLMWQI